MQLKVKMLKGGREEVVKVRDGTVSVLQLKTILQDVFQIPVHEQSLVLRGRALSDDHHLDSYGVEEGTKIFLSHKTHVNRAATTVTSEAMDNRASAVVMETSEPMDTDRQFSLNVKILQGDREETITVKGEESTVNDVKREIEMKCRIPSHLQALVIRGTALDNNNRLCDYGIKSGDRIFLAQKSTPPLPPPPPSDQTWQPSQTALYGRLKKFLSQHFSDDDSDKIALIMCQNLRKQLTESNLDSIEYLAIRTLREHCHTHN